MTYSSEPADIGAAAAAEHAARRCPTHDCIIDDIDPCDFATDEQAGSTHYAQQITAGEPPALTQAPEGIDPVTGEVAPDGPMFPEQAS